MGFLPTYGMLTMGFTMGSYQLLSFCWEPRSSCDKYLFYDVAEGVSNVAFTGQERVAGGQMPQGVWKWSQWLKFFDGSVIIHQVPHDFSKFWGRIRRSSLFLVTTICSQLVGGNSNGGSPGLDLAVGRCVFTFLLTLQISSKYMWVWFES
jgi:hypothetical protein